MKKRQFAILSATILLSALTVLYSCKKDEDEVKEFDTQSSQDNSLAESTFSDVLEISNQAIANQNGLTTYRLGDNQGTLLSNCATVTLTPDSSGQGGNVVVDFGSHTCLCSDGRYRKGIINVNYSGTYRDSGAVITSTFQNYFVGADSVNIYQVTGSKTVTNNGHNSSGNLWYSVDVNGQLENRNGAMMSWNSQRQREWIAGESTSGLFGWADDEYRITGSANGTTFEGKTYTASITKGLVVALNCWWIKEGTFELTPAGLATRIFDYGDGTCDRKATVTVNGATFEITMR